MIILIEFGDFFCDRTNKTFGLNIYIHIICNYTFSEKSSAKNGSTGDSSERQMKAFCGVNYGNTHGMI